MGGVDLGYPAELTIAGEGPAVVLVPGMDGTGRLFYRQAPGLAARHRVATYALRHRADEMAWLVEDLAAVVGAAAPATGRAIVVGESFGGAVALSFALAHRDRVEALVVVNSFPYFAPQPWLQLAIAALRLVPWGTMALVRRATAFRMHSPRTHRAEIRRFLELSRGISREGYVNRLRILQRYDVRHRLSELRMPVLFVAAEKDRLVSSVAQARLMAAAVPGAALRILDGHGHICLIAPDVDLATILAEWRGI